MSPARLDFTGHEDDADLGLVNMRGRLCDPQLGRFLTPDPIVAHPGFGQSWNHYSYVLDGPLSYVDPTGFTEEEPQSKDPWPNFDPFEPAPFPPIHVTITPFPVDEDEPDEPSEAAASGATVAPQDTNTWGHNAGWLPQPAATTTEQPQRPWPSQIQS